MIGMFRSNEVHGELRNNVRMTWGKALLEWTRDPATALATLVDLNHRYALDGRDPASRVRKPVRVVVVGAGLSGLACARTLADHGCTVTVVDKGRRPGGRATSRHERDGVFDHGAQFFTAHGEWLTRHVTSWEADGVVARWTPRLVQTGGARPRRPSTWWVGTPSMGALATHLARGLDGHVRLEAKVSRVSRSPDGTWTVEWAGSGGNAGPAVVADALVVAVPAAQAAALLEGVHAELAGVASSVKQTPCWAVMTTVRGMGDLGGDVFEDGKGPVAWATREGSKPGRSGSPERLDDDDGEARWLLHASAEWSAAHLGEPAETVGQNLTAAFLDERGARDASALRVRAHLWRYAQGHLPDARGALFDPGARLAVCGDWVNGSRIEGALTSGVAAAGRLLGLAVEQHES